jgi:hypothetical protein
LLDGAAGPVIEAYETERDRECTAYLYERALYFGAEHRWHDAPFWTRRAAAAYAERAIDVASSGMIVRSGRRSA